MNYNRLTFSSAEDSLIKLDDLKRHLRILHDTEDALIQGYLDTAIFHYENFTGRIVNSSKFKCTLDHFPNHRGTLDRSSNHWGTIELMRYPVTEITEIKYVDTAGEEQTLPLEYCRIDYSEPLRLAPALNKTWPFTACVLGAVTIKFDCGYKAIEALPPSARQSILMIAGHFYTHRELVVVGRIVNSIPYAAQMLMENDKISNRF